MSQLLAAGQGVRHALRPPELHRTPATGAGWTEEQSPQNTENRNVTVAGGQDLVLFHGLHIQGQGGGKEKEPYWEEELGEPLK